MLEKCVFIVLEAHIFELNQIDIFHAGLESLGFLGSAIDDPHNFGEGHPATSQIGKMP